MHVTINTDASFHPEWKVGAFAYWIVCDGVRIKNSGVFKELVKSATEAEIKCIINALHHLNKSNFKSIKKVIINTDCLNFIQSLNGHNQFLWGLNKQYTQVGNKLVKKYNLSRGWLEARHVKAHSGTETARKYVNDWCDQAAKTAMRAKVYSLKLEKKASEQLLKNIST